MGDYLLETLAIVIFLAIWIQAMYYWPQLPERIPVHLNGAGQVDGWGKPDFHLVYSRHRLC
ncbi:MAG: DUF1648 domain-containing protein [Saprospiraceae bacterium]